ncbi:NAD-dependent SIR2 family protein deacetylase [Natronospira proteinivora]|uniref:protein acetyllysine N-acetyltransferase n=1 Tax=Natronospira proteinivora TaxID=1807133 RepID=A0ABT1G9N2_9GAMM|nr:NAD-dependent protein deacetylase [Natronospira proteinivora]MCP1728029.1 NAD-dependent SIR2 family protein deacetylase [Natronospira proteinivora]
MKAPNVRIPEFRRWPSVTVPEADPADLARFLETHPHCLFLTGAGCSTASGIPAYRDRQGRWTRRQPIQYQAFMASAATRQRYWARSYLGWPRIQAALPNPAHHALASMQAMGIGKMLVTQNVDALHQRAGSSCVVELHGRLSEVVCQACGERLCRDQVQRDLIRLNGDWDARVQGINPDGDAELREADHGGFRPSDCHRCQGILKPDVVFFGENVPATRVTRIRDALAESDAVVVVGSSLVVWSGYRFVREAASRGLPVVAVNQGRTRADALLTFKLGLDCDQALTRTMHLLGDGGSQEGVPSRRP